MDETMCATTPARESLDALLTPQARERQAAFEFLRAEASEVGAEMQRRAATEAVPVVARYGGLPVELEMQLDEAKRALDDEAAVVVIVPRPNRYGYTKPEAFAIGDVSRIFRS